MENNEVNEILNQLKRTKSNEVKDRKEILEKLSKDNKNKNINLLKKLETLVEKKVSNNNLIKKKSGYKKILSGRKFIL